MSETWEQTKLRLKRQGIEVKPVSIATELPKPRYQNVVNEETLPIKPDTPDTKAVTQERWTVYYFTLPVKYSKKIAHGFDSKESAKKFIESRLVKRTPEGRALPKALKDEHGIEYAVYYDVILESREEVDVYANDPEITTVGNDKNDVLDRWNSVDKEFIIERNNHQDVPWVG